MARTRIQRLLLFKEYIDFLTEKELERVDTPRRANRRTTRDGDDRGDVRRDEVVKDG